MHRVNSIPCRVDIQDLFNEDMDAQAVPRFLLQLFLGQLQTHEALLELQRDFKGKSGNFSVENLCV